MGEFGMTNAAIDNSDASDCPPVTETFAQYSFRLAREARLRKDAIAKELLEKRLQLLEQKRQRRERSKEERRLDRESRRQIRPDLMELVGEIAKVESAKSAEIARRKQLRLCVCCGDYRGDNLSNYCQECWSEIKYGVIRTPEFSERQIESARCRVIRKGSEMS